jgi:hypothetical protein
MDPEDDIAGRDGGRVEPLPLRGALPGDDEPVDEELLALSVPPPSPRQALFILVVLGLSLFMLAWFFPDLRYLLRAFEEPADLGEAADLHPGRFEAQSIVRLHGIPMTNRTLAFSKGVRWFSDTARKVFPLAGRPELLVEWRIPAKERAYRDPDVNPEGERLPFDFQGRLVPRADLGARYERIWLFYDCLEGYSVRECKLCLGAGGMEQCRQRIACALEIGEDCRTVLSDPRDGRHAAVQRKAAELAVEEAARLHGRLTEQVARWRQMVDVLERDLADLTSGRMLTRLEGEIAEVRGKLQGARDEERRILEDLGRRGLDGAGLKAAAGRAAEDLEVVQVGIRDLVRRAEAARGDAGAPDAGASDAGAPEDFAGRLAELGARRDELQRRADEERTLLDRLREAGRQARERAEAVAGLESRLADARSGALATRLEEERERDRVLRAALAPNAARLDEIGARLAALEPGAAGIDVVLGDLREVRLALGLTQWVLVDGDAPIDSAWVIAVYIVFLLMIVANARHLYRFWLAWKA